MRKTPNRREPHHQLIREAKAQGASELRQAALHVHNMARQRGLSMLMVAGLALLGGYALHAGAGHAGGMRVPAATQSR